METSGKMAGLRVHVQSPEGIEVAGASVSFRPKTAEEFEAIAEALGGLDSLRMPQQALSYYDDPAWATVAVEGDLRVAALIYPPPRGAFDGPEPTPAPHPFFGRYTEGRQA